MLEHGLVGAAVAGAVERRCGRGSGRVRVGVGGADSAHGGGGAVLLVVGVEDEQHVEGPGQHRVGVVAGLGDLPHHRQEVGAEVERVVRVDERHADAEAVGAGRERRHLRDQTDDLPIGVRVVDVLGLGVERRQRRDRRDQHAHGVGVVVEALHEPLAHVLVDERVVDDVVAPLLELLRVGSSPLISRYATSR
jgi:hypothetical protein